MIQKLKLLSLSNVCSQTIERSNAFLVFQRKCSFYSLGANGHLEAEAVTPVVVRVLIVLEAVVPRGEGDDDCRVPGCE